MGGLSAATVDGDGPAPDVLLARAYLSRVAEPGSGVLWAFVEQLGPLAAAEAVRRRQAPGPVLAATVARAGHADAAADLDAAARHGVRLLTPESADWPHFAFSALEASARRRSGARAASDVVDLVPPLALWARGPAELRTAAVRSVAVVGARAATSYGEHVTAELAFGLARRDVTVVSGGAYGIDAAAHRAALAAEGATVLVSAGGLDRAYPAGHAALFDRVAETGLLLSESPPGAAPQRHRFLSRNRLIAALATGTLVVEAAARSGARNTANHTIALGRPLMAVPGPVTSALSAGCHELLRREHGRALLVSCVDDVLDVVGSIGETLDSASAGGRSDALHGVDPVDPLDPVRAALDGLDPAARQVFDGLPARASVREDELALRCGVGVVEVLRALPLLRLAGIVESDDSGHRIARGALTGRAPSRTVGR